MPKKRANYRLRVGLFVTLALLVFGSAVFVIGQERSLFASKTKLNTSFRDVNGLVVGAPVRLAGMDVGRVSKLTFGSELEQVEARVELAIEDRFMPRVRRDTNAYIDSKGLLGDKLINLTVGSATAPPLVDGDYVQPKEGLSFEALAQQLGGTANAIGRTADKASEAVEELASPEVSDNVRRATGSLAAILAQVERGDGLAHRVLYDASYAQRAGDALDAMRSSARRLDTLLAQAQHGPGTLHSVLYGTEGSSALSSLARAADDIAIASGQLNRGDGLARSLLHDGAGRRLVQDLAELSDRLNRISAHVERGRGTLGGLLIDPSVYEDLKTVLGNIERNNVLKALIRLTIKEDGLKRPALEAKPVPAP
jgi:phospholipid/cholesterol/gamma-HCH transport system substrate-binding protein